MDSWLTADLPVHEWLDALTGLRSRRMAARTLRSTNEECSDVDGSQAMANFPDGRLTKKLATEVTRLEEQYIKRRFSSASNRRISCREL